jgi:hypothetical protein
MKAHHILIGLGVYIVGIYAVQYAFGTFAWLPGILDPIGATFGYPAKSAT